MLIWSIYQYGKDYGHISSIFYGEGFKTMIKNYLHVDLKKDWIGRLYGIINPNIDVDGNFNVNSIIVEMDGKNTNNNEYLKTWIHKQLFLMKSLFNFDNLYTYIILDIKPVGPAIGDNYLLVFDIASRKNMTKYFKQTFIQIIIYGIILISLFKFVL